MTYFKLEDMDFKDKRVLVRLGTDMPLDDSGDITDDKRIKISLPTLKYLLEHGAQQIILMCHIGRPTEPSEKLSTKKTAARLGEVLGEKVVYVEDWGETGLPDERIIFLENVRFNKAEKSKDEKKRDAFGKQLAALADVFVQDAFSNCHHPEQASMTGVLPYIPGCLGKCPEREISIISETMKNPDKPFVSIIGGFKAEKLNAVRNLLEKVDHILLGGGLAFALLHSMGVTIGATKFDNDGMENLQELVQLVKTSDKVELPVDAIIAREFKENTEREVVDIHHIKDTWMVMDIGPKTVDRYCAILKKAKTALFNGPVGVYEFEPFAQGTRKIVETLSKLDATTVVGGGDSVDAVQKFGDPDEFTLVSSGGGACLALFEGKELGAVTALEENYEKFKR